jgi:hypothetical protein
MRAFILIAVPALLLSACGKNNSAGQAQNVGENLSAETIVANDVTAIDAVTGDAANMAADVPLTNELEGNLDEMVNQGAPKTSPRTRAPGKPPLETPTPANNAAE